MKTPPVLLQTVILSGIIVNSAFLVTYPIRISLDPWYSMNDDKADNQQIKEEEKFSSRQGLLFTRDIDIERYKRLKLLSDIIVVSAVFTVLINLAWDSLIIVTTGVSLDREVIIPSVQDYPEPPLVFATLFLSLMAGDILGKSIIQVWSRTDLAAPTCIFHILSKLYPDNSNSFSTVCTNCTNCSIHWTKDQNQFHI